jgi:hypothetical protein
MKTTLKIALYMAFLLKLVISCKPAGKIEDATTGFDTIRLEPIPNVTDSTEFYMEPLKHALPR